MRNDDNLLPSIPPFLRRFEESPPRKLPVRPRDLPAAPSQPARQSKPTATRAAPAAASAPSAAPAPPATPTPSATPKVVDKTPPSAAEDPAAQRGRIALAFENRDLPEGAAEGAAGEAARGPDSEDVAFQVSLPRGVVRQLGLLAAEKDTTQRDVVLHALHLAGLSVPEISDIDRPAKRQNQA